MLAALLARDGATVVRINANPFGSRHPRLKRFLHVWRELRRLEGCDLALVFAGPFNSFFAFTAVPLWAARRWRVPAVVMFKGGWARASWRGGRGPRSRF